MLDFLLTGTDLNGKRDTHRLQARDSQEAYQQLESQGFTDIVLHTDDAEAAAGPMTVFDDGHITPRDIVEVRLKSRFESRWYFLKKMVRSRWWLWLSLIVVGLMWQHDSLASISVFVGLVAACVLVFQLLNTDQFDQFDEMIDSFFWARWNDVLHRVESLQGTVSDFNLDVFKAGALAGLGRFDEGLEVFENWEDSDDVPHWMYVARKSEFYTAAGMPDEALRCMAQAYEEDPENPTVMIDYSIALSRAGEQTELAGRLIQSAERMHLSDILAMILPMAKGLWLTTIGSSHAAIEEFERLRENLWPMAKANPAFPLLLDLNQAYLAVALLQLGDRERAAREAKPALPRLRALKRTRLLEKLSEIAD